MKQQHHPVDKKSYEKGINSDSNKEILGTKEGEHVDAKNMRSIPMDGDNLAKKKIKGEELLYPNIDNRCVGGTGLPLSEQYECMMTQEINGHIVEVWGALEQYDLPALIRIDGKITLMSEDFPVLADYPLEYHKNEACIGGEFYITDNRVVPMVFNVKDLLINSGINVGSDTGLCTTKYFEDFNLEEYTVGVSSSLYKIAFIKQQSGTGNQHDFVFGSDGLLVGSYSYSYRYATEVGDRSAWSPVSEIIPVIAGKSNISPELPKVGNFSKDPSLVPSIFGNEIRLKYDNENGFEFIEIRRDGWYFGSTLNSPPVSEVIGAFPIDEGLNTVNILDYASNVETEEVLTEDDILDTPQQVESAKAIRYFNSKLWLMNVKYASRDVDDVVNIIDELDPVFSTVEKIGKKGHVDVYHSTYHKSNMRGEAHGFGVLLFDSTGSKTYAKSIVDNFQFPNRRDEMSSDSLGTSYYGASIAATTQGTVGYTHEVFDLEDAVGREDEAEMNILQDRYPTLLSGPVNVGPYKTMHPISQTDSASDYGSRVNVKVKEALEDNFYADYDPKAFGIDYYSQGLAFKGLETSGLEKFDGFSVVQTNPAKRVVAQGFAFYDIRSHGGGALKENSSKSRNSVIVNFPDLDGDIGISPQVIEELLTNVGSNSPYRLELVSPLGHFTEIHGWAQKYFPELLGNPNVEGFDAKSQNADIISYCRVLHAKNGEINPGFYNTDGIGGGYTAFGTWREGTVAAPFFQDPLFPNTNPGSFTIEDFQEVATQTGVGINYRVTLDANIYDQEFASGLTQDIANVGVRKWTEPMYVVNIVKEEAQINPGILTSYNYTGHYIKLKSKILVSDGTSIQSATLVSERWEDCIRSLSGQVFNNYSSLERFTWVTSSDDTPRRWLNITGKTQAQIDAIQNDITANGFHTITDSSGSYDVYGTYTHQETLNGSAKIFTLTFSDLLDGDIVEVRYDNRIPVRVFGGDTYVNEHVWAYQDNEYENNIGESVGAEFGINIPFPMAAYKKAENYLILRRSIGVETITGPVFLSNNNIGNFRWDSGLAGGAAPLGGINPCNIRQLIVMWTAETRTNLSFSFNIDSEKTNYAQQSFPLKNYIPRPAKWRDGSEETFPPDAGNFLEKNNMHLEYYDDYGDEWIHWTKGGFRYKPQVNIYKPQVNIDYSKKQTTEIVTSKPAIGFEEETEFCTRILWSVTRPINIQSSPSVRTFPPSNFHDISDNTGEIKFAWDADSAKGNNLYALTDSGVALILTDKRILSEINSNELATIGSDIGGVVTELWIDKSKGMDRETWRTWAEYSNTLFWVNSTSSYSLSDNVITDLAEGGYSELLRDKFIPKFDANGGEFSKLAGVYDILHKEYYATADNRGQSGENHSTLIYGTTQEALQCQSDYRYDKYLAVNNKVYGMKKMETFELGVGNLLDGDTYECYLTGVSDADTYSDKEFIRIRVNSKSKPKRIEFYDDYEQYKTGVPSSIVDATADPINIKDYFGFECYVPRKELAPHNRQQGRLVIFKIVSDEDENFFVSTTGVQYKTLK
jgi:hypothetical protein